MPTRPRRPLDALIAIALSLVSIVAVDRAWGLLPRTFMRDTSSFIQPRPDLPDVPLPHGIFPPAPADYPDREAPPVRLMQEKTRVEEEIHAWGPLPGTILSVHKASFHTRKVSDTGRVVYDLRVGIDRFFRRITTAPRKPASKFLLLLNASILFGSGVADDETFASQLVGLLPGYRVYNYSIQGSKPVEDLDRLRSIQPGEITEPTGTVLEFYSHIQIFRSMGELLELGVTYGRPCYELDRDGVWRARRTCGEEFPVRTFLGRIAVKSNIATHFKLRWPPRPGRLAAGGFDHRGHQA